MGTEKDLILGVEPIMQCVDDVLLSCTFASYMVLLTDVNLVNSVKVIK